MAGRVDPDIEKILPLLPLRDAANLTPQRARAELVALTDSRKEVPLPQPAAVADLIFQRRQGQSQRECIARQECRRPPSCSFMAAVG